MNRRFRILVTPLIGAFAEAAYNFPGGVPLLRSADTGAEPWTPNSRQLSLNCCQNSWSFRSRSWVCSLLKGAVSQNSEVARTRSARVEVSGVGNTCWPLNGWRSGRQSMLASRCDSAKQQPGRYDPLWPSPWSIRKSQDESSLTMSFNYVWQLCITTTICITVGVPNQSA